MINDYDALCFVAEHNNYHISDYIAWGEANDYHRRSVTSNQNPWFKPTNQMRDGATILVPRSFNDIFSVHFNPHKYLSLRFYRLHAFDESTVLQLIGYLNSTLVILFQESFGNKSLGQGALDFFMAYFLRMEVPIVLSESYEKILSDSFMRRKINPIFDELGFNRDEPIRQQQPNPLPDRKALDDIIFDELGLNPEERNEVYWATAELVKQRLDKAGSR